MKSPEYLNGLLDAGRRATERQLRLPENREKPEFEQDFFELVRDFDYQRLDLITAVKTYTFGKKETEPSLRRIEEAAGDCMAFLCAIAQLAEEKRGHAGGGT